MKYSVIIPVYNAERTLRRCLDSLLPQLNSDIEVLLINDGSCDKSEIICKEYEVKCEFIKCYSQKNSGVSVARNKGIDLAIGDYILFVDSDDYICSNYFYTISDYIESNDPDLLLFGAEFLDRSNNSIVCYGDNSTFSGEEVAKRFLYLYKKDNVYTLWNKAFRKQIIDERNIRFDSRLHNGEDAVFIFHFFLYTKRMMTCEDVLYYVDESNHDSLSRKQRENLCDEIIAATKKMEMYLDESSQKAECFGLFHRCISWGHYRGAYACFNDIIKSNNSKNKINTGIRKVCESYRLEFVKPIGLDTIIISIPILWKMVSLIRLLFCAKKYR